MTDQAAYTVAEAARMLSISTRLMQRQVASGKIRSFKIGHCRRISRQAIEAYIQQQEGGNVDHLQAQGPMADPVPDQRQTLHIVRGDAETRGDDAQSPC